MLQNVLVPLDASKLAEIALPYAQHVVNKDGTITLLMVIESVKELKNPEIFAGIDPNVEEQTNYETRRKHAQDYLNRIASHIASMHLKVETRLQGGNPADEIVNIAADMDAIVMSTHGRTGVTRWLLGSVTQKVITAAPCPVFVVPHRNDA